jgi:hypothetical protein
MSLRGVCGCCAVVLVAAALRPLSRSRRRFRPGSNPFASTSWSQTGTAGARPDAGGLRALDNGVPQQVDLVSYEQIPLNIVLALDMSDSVAGDRLEHCAPRAPRSCPA